MRLCYPDATEPIDRDIAKQYKWNRDLYVKTAQEWTQKYASPTVKARLSPAGRMHTLKEIALRHRKKRSFDQKAQSGNGPRSKTKSKERIMLYNNGNRTEIERDDSLIGNGGGGGGGNSSKDESKSEGKYYGGGRGLMFPQTGVSNEVKTELNAEIGGEVRRARERAAKLQSEIGYLQTLVRIKQSQLENALALVKQLETQYIT